MILLFAQRTVQLEHASLLGRTRRPEHAENRNASWLIARSPFRSAQTQAGENWIRCAAPRPTAEAPRIREERTLVLKPLARSRRAVCGCCEANGPPPRP